MNQPLPIEGLQVISEVGLASHLHMALDEVHLDAVGALRRPPLLRFWGWLEPTLVIGSNQSVANEVDLEAASRHGFLVTRRLSGGGTMLAQPGGTITWSVIASEREVAGLSFRESYAHLDSWAVATLRDLGIDAGYQPINDIVSPFGKIAGAAQARRRGVLLHHVTMAYAMTPGLLTELIRLGRPPRTERGVRSANRPVSALSELSELSREEIVSALARRAGGRPGQIEAGELAAAEELAATKYSRREWIHRLG